MPVKKKNLSTTSKKTTSAKVSRKKRKPAKSKMSYEQKANDYFAIAGIVALLALVGVLTKVTFEQNVGKGYRTPASVLHHYGPTKNASEYNDGHHYNTNKNKKKYYHSWW